ncbi:hypothetical protein [Sutcliffiella horikoshii]|uniref:hypothetical protein n=1 Tax=Sutcliffiella horikoshii TaxID=79883 RepID=UPI00384B5695
MKKVILVGTIIIVALLNIACSKTTEEIVVEAPDYISETWVYYEQMNNTIDSIEDGENIKIAFEKHFSTESELKMYIDNADMSRSSSEQQAVIENLYLMYLKLTTMAIENINASMGGSSVDVERYLYELQVPQYELEKIYEEYGLKNDE